MVKYVKAGPDEFGYWSDAELDEFVLNHKQDRDTFYSKNGGKVALAKALLSVDRDEFNKNADEILHTFFFDNVPHKQYFESLGIKTSYAVNWDGIDFLWFETYGDEPGDYTTYEPFRDCVFYYRGKKYNTTKDIEMLVDLCNQSWNNVKLITKSIFDNNNIDSDALSATLYYDFSDGDALYYKMYADIPDNYETIGKYKSTYYANHKELKAKTAYDAFIEIYDLQSIIDKLKSSEITQTGSDFLNLSAFVTDDYRKGSSDTSIPSAISSYAEDDLAFEFEGQFNESVARRFVDKFLADHKLNPKRIYVLDFYDDTDSDENIGLVVSCKF